MQHSGVCLGAADCGWHWVTFVVFEDDGFPQIPQSPPAASPTHTSSCFPLAPKSIGNFLPQSTIAVDGRPADIPKMTASKPPRRAGTGRQHSARPKTRNLIRWTGKLQPP